MNTVPNVLPLETSSTNVPALKALRHEASPTTINYEVKIRPLPPEIDRLVRKYLSRY